MRFNHKIPVIIDGEIKYFTAKEWYEFLDIPQCTFQSSVKLLRDL